ncbi:tetratricopeptide repeat protein 19, mitochondrial-like [Anneissia japonica]|uniref:tetratricopeptide repeat protein 19, mitochondrial-like n=1 Tax=Anneissia japonica TaxID=1529436 RepID=UPI0014256989|nr:tetratricopeptide repeat protein 19, mitochondrial-like [Anneissia japonica]
MAAPMMKMLVVHRIGFLSKSLHVITLPQSIFRLNVCRHMCYRHASVFPVSIYASCNLVKSRNFARPRPRFSCGNFSQCQKYSSRHDRPRLREREKLFGPSNENPQQKVFEEPKTKTGDDNTLFIITGGLVALGAIAIYKWSRDESKITVSGLISKALVAERRNNAEEAEALFHDALQLAQETDDQEAFTFTLDQMANLALRRHQDEKAEKLIKDTIKNLIANGVDKTGNAVIELSIKLANIYSQFNKCEEAESGYDWCITALENKMHKPDNLNDFQEGDSSLKEEKSDIQALLGMSLENYAKLLSKQKRYKEAEDAYLKAIDICQNDLSTNEIKHPQIVVLLNDLGTLYHSQKKYKEALECLVKAVEEAKCMSHPDLATALCNLASCQMYMRVFDSARDNFQHALKLAERQGDSYAIKMIKDMMAQLETEMYLQHQKKS